MLDLPRSDVLQIQAANSFKDTQLRENLLRDAYQ
jgi:hypothetical protein